MDGVPQRRAGLRLLALLLRAARGQADLAVSALLFGAFWTVSLFEMSR